MVGVDEYEERMRGLYKQVAEMEEAEERPKVHVQSSVIELGRVWWAPSPGLCWLWRRR